MEDHDVEISQINGWGKLPNKWLYHTGISYVALLTKCIEYWLRPPVELFDQVLNRYIPNIIGETQTHLVWQAIRSDTIVFVREENLIYPTHFIVSKFSYSLYEIASHG